MLHSLKDWQTLIGSGFAIGAAFIGGRLIMRQITHADTLETRRIDRRRLAARAVLPLTVSALSSWTREAATALREALAHCRGVALPRDAAPIAVPPPPAEAIDALERLVGPHRYDMLDDAMANVVAEANRNLL